MNTPRSDQRGNPCHAGENMPGVGNSVKPPKLSRRRFLSRFALLAEGASLCAPTAYLALGAGKWIASDFATALGGKAALPQQTSIATNYTHSFQNGAILRILGVSHSRAWFEADRASLRSAIEQSDLIMLEGERKKPGELLSGYFEGVEQMALSLGKRVQWMESKLSSDMGILAMAAGQVASLCFGWLSLKRGFGKEWNRKKWPIHVGRAAAWLGGSFFSFPSILAIFGAQLDTLVKSNVDPKGQVLSDKLDISYPIDGRSVDFLALSLGETTSAEKLRVLSVVGDMHGSAMQRYLETGDGRREFMLKCKIYSFFYAPFMTAKKSWQLE